MTGPTPSVDTHDMLLIHRVIRREIGLLPSLFRAASDTAQRAGRIATHAREMLDFLHVHHHGEDTLVWPLLRERTPLDADLVDRMAAQHREVSCAVERLRLDLDGWEASADGGLGDRLATTAGALSAVLDAHLDDEELHLLPLVATTLTPHEWNQLAKLGMAAVPGRRRLAILGHILEEADAAERSQFLTRVPPPARVAFKMFGQRQHAREVASIRG